MVFKKKVLCDWDLFISFWKNLPRMRSWKDAVEYGELKLTQYYIKRGIVCRAIANRDLLPSKDVNPSFYYPIELFQNGSPLLKKKIFTENYKLQLHFTNGNIPSSALSYVKEKKGRYAEILEELIQQVSPSKLLQTLHLNFLVTGRAEKRSFRGSTAVICFVYYDDMVGYISRVLKRFSGIGNIYVVSPKKELLESYRTFLGNTDLNIEYRLQVNRGRNEAAYFLTCRDVWNRYDYVCALHDKKTSHAKPELLGIDFMKHCEQNLCPSSTSILEVINLFETNPLLGLLVPPFPFYGNFIFSAFNPLGQNLKSLQLINKKIFCGKLFSSKDEIDVFLAPFGGMFWARTKSFRLLWSSSLKFEDFPEEPLKTSDGTILHAMERVYPMLVREKGFYTGRLVNADLVPCLYDNLIFFSIKMTRRERFLFVLEEVARKNLSQYPVLYKAIKSIYKKIKSS